jgi:hypothetical protein
MVISVSCDFICIYKYICIYVYARIYIYIYVCLCVCCLFGFNQPQENAPVTW